MAIVEFDRRHISIKIRCNIHPMTGGRTPIQLYTTTRTGKRKRIPTREPRQTVSDEEREEEERKRRNKAAEEEKERRDWIQSVNMKGFTCERQLDRDQYAGHPIIKVIEDQRLHFYFKTVDGFRERMVRDFYINMEIYEGEQTICSVFGSKTVTVTPNSIATYLGYERPTIDAITYPRQAWAVPDDDIVTALTDNPNSYNNGRFKSGSLTDRYRLINWIVHYNLNPHGSEKSPWMSDGRLLYVFNHGEKEKVDWAKWIWDVMVEFWSKGPSNANIPFPAMVTKLCEDAKVKPEKGDTKGHHGCRQAIRASSEKKSKAMSQPPRTETTSSSKHKPTANSYDTIETQQRRLDKRLDRLERDNSKMKRWLKWLMDKVGTLTNDPYLPTEDDETTTEEEEDDEDVDE